MPKTTAKTTKSNKTSKSSKGKTVSRAASVTVPHEITIPDEFRPISMWGYFAYTLLFAIPVIGWAFCIYFAFMGSNYNLRNFSRSQFCWIIIYIVMVCIMFSLGVLQTIFQTLF